MHAIILDLDVAELKTHYGDPYNNAYSEIRQVLRALGFDWTQGSVYLSTSNKDNLTAVYKAINALSKISWFKKSVRDIRAFKVEDWSDFTAIVRDEPEPRNARDEDVFYIPHEDFYQRANSLVGSAF